MFSRRPAGKDPFQNNIRATTRFTVWHSEADGVFTLLEPYLCAWCEKVSSVQISIGGDRRRLFTFESPIRDSTSGGHNLNSAVEIFQCERHNQAPRGCSLILQQLSRRAVGGDESSPWTLTAGVRTATAAAVACRRSQLRSSSLSQSANGAWQGNQSEWCLGCLIHPFSLTPHVNPGDSRRAGCFFFINPFLWCFAHIFSSARRPQRCLPTGRRSALRARESQPESC